MPYTAERYHDFCAGHRVYGHESKCAHLHGHNYRVHFTCIPAPVQAPARKFLGQQPLPVVPQLDTVGRVVDFSVIKSTLCEWLEVNWDHKMLLWEKDPLLGVIYTLDEQGVVAVPFNPTAENMAQYLVEVIGPQLLVDAGVVLAHVRIEETRKCSASYAMGEQP